MPGADLRAIRRSLNTRNDASLWLFLNERGQPVTRRSVNHIIEKVSLRTGLSTVHPQMLRDLGGFYLAKKGYDLRLIQDYLVHRHPEHTVHYTGVGLRRFDNLRR